MKLVYMSHPYTGNEKENVQKMREYCLRVKYQHPEWVLINPLDNHTYAHEKYSYDEFMKMDMELLARCEIIVFCGDWEHSKGCMKEYKEAKRLNKDIYFERK